MDSSYSNICIKKCQQLTGPYLREALLHSRPDICLFPFSCRLSIPSIAGKLPAKFFPKKDNAGSQKYPYTGKFI